VAQTYATLTAEPAGTTPVVRLELWGIPHKLSSISNAGADGDGSTAYSVKPVSIVSRIPDNYTAQQKVGYRQVLQRLSTFGEKYDPVAGSSSLGSLTAEFIDPTDYFANLFAALKTSSRVTSLNASLTATATSINVVSALTAGTAYFLADETFVAQASTTTPNIRRGTNAAKSPERAHTASSTSDPYPDDIYSHPRVWRNRIIALYLGFDHADVSASNERGPYVFRLRELGRVTTGGRVHWQIKADSYLGTLARHAAFGAYRATLRSMNAVGGGISWINALPTGETNARRPSFTDVGDRVWMRLGDEAVELQMNTNTADYTLAHVVTRGAFSTGESSHGPGEEFVEILPTHPRINTPRIGHVPHDGGYTYGDLVASDHPLRAALCLILSRTGDLTNYETAGDNNYDVLPAPWGLALPATRLDLTSWERAITETPGARFPRFLLGWDGSFSVMEWLNREVLTLLGYAVYTNSSGRLALARVGDRYPFESSVSVSLADMSRDYHDYSLNVADTTGRVIIEYVNEDGAPRTIIANSTWAANLHREEVKTRKIKSAGATDRTRLFLAQRAAAIIQREEFPQPTARFTLSYRTHAGTREINPGTLLAVTDAQMPSPTAGTIGVTTDYWRALSVEVQPYEARMVVHAQRADAEAVRFGPAAIVSSWDGVNLDATLSANEFTPTTTLGEVPNSDIKAFGDDGSQGGAGCLVEFCNLDGSRWNDASDTIELVTLTHSSRVARLSASPKVGGVNTSPANKVMRLAPYTATVDAAVSGGTVSSQMRNYLYIAANATQLIDTGIAGKRWGA